MVGVEGLEPSQPVLKGRCNNHYATLPLLCSHTVPTYKVVFHVNPLIGWYVSIITNIILLSSYYANLSISFPIIDGQEHIKRMPSKEIKVKTISETIKFSFSI